MIGPVVTLGAGSFTTIGHFTLLGFSPIGVMGAWDDVITAEVRVSPSVATINTAPLRAAIDTSPLDASIDTAPVIAQIDAHPLKVH